MKLLPWLFLIVPFACWAPLASPYTGAKWLVLMAAAVVVCFGLILNNYTQYLPKKFALLLLAMLGLEVWNYFTLNRAYLDQPQGERLAFWILTAGWYVLFMRGVDGARAVCFFARASSPLLLIVAAHAVITRGYGLFGNVNMTAEFIALSMIPTVWANWEPWRRKVEAGVALAAVLLGCVALVQLGSRSAWLAIGLAVLHTYGLFGARRHWIALFTLLAVSCAQSDSRRWDDRLALAVDTVELIAEHPLGVGLGNYAFAIVPYGKHGSYYDNQQQLYKSPHNEYLRLAAEDGLPMFLMLLLGGVWLYRALLKKAHPIGWHSIDGLLAPMWTFILVQAFFQFPLENPYPSLVMAMVLGRSIYLIANKTANHRDWGTLLISPIFALTFIATVLTYKSEVVNGSAIFDEAAATEVCKLSPRQWKTCLNVARAYASRGDIATAIARTEDVLTREPHNYFARDSLDALRDVWAQMDDRL